MSDCAPRLTDKVRIIMSGPRILSAAVEGPSQLLFLIVDSRRGGCSPRRPQERRRERPRTLRKKGWDHSELDDGEKEGRIEGQRRNGQWGR